VVDAMDGTGAGLVAFLDYTGDKGLLTKSNAKTIKVGVREVLEQAEGPDWETKDVRTLDVEDAVSRFETKRAVAYTPKSLAAYGQRFRTAMNMYRGFLADPGGWRPSRQPRSTSTRRQKNGDRPQAKVTLAANAPSPPADEGSDRPEMMTYPFPLRRDGGVVFARLILPHDLTPAEAKRIGDHINTLAIDVPESPKPSSDPDPEPSTSEPPA
jgi:hypothetical protein